MPFAGPSENCTTAISSPRVSTGSYGAENGNLSPVLMSRRISIQSDYQMKQPLLCSACERRFSENGENYVVPLLNNGRGFPLLDRLKLALPLYTTATNTAFVCPAVGLSGENIGYFGLSILWRAAVRPWRMFDGDAISVTLDPAHLELVRRYLAGETAFPGRLPRRNRHRGNRLPVAEHLLRSQPGDGQSGHRLQPAHKGPVLPFRVRRESSAADARDLLHRPRTGPDLSQRRERQVMGALRRDDGNHRTQGLARRRALLGLSSRPPVPEAILSS